MSGGDARRRLLGEVDGLFVELDLEHDRVARDLGVARSDLTALVVLDAADAPVGLADLGRRLGLGRPATTALADRLSARGLVHRVADPDDRRRVRLELSDDARAVAGQVTRDLARRLSSRLTGWTRQDLTTAADVLRAVRDGLAADDGPEAAGAPRPADAPPR